MKKAMAICEIYRNESNMFSSASMKAIEQAFKNQRCVISFDNEFNMFTNMSDLKENFDLSMLDQKCGKLKITDSELEDFSTAVDFAQNVSEQTGCKLFIMNF